VGAHAIKTIFYQTKGLMPGSNPPQSPTGQSSEMTAGEYIADLVKTDGVAVAVLSGVGATFILGASGEEAVSFGAIVALGNSLGSWAGTIAGNYVNLNTRFGKYGPELDPNDFVETALGAGVVQYLASGLQGAPLYKAMAIAGVAGVLAPMLANKIHSLAYDTNSGKKGGSNGL
jgi:hypothetical protein